MKFLKSNVNPSIWLPVIILILIFDTSMGLARAAGIVYDVIGANFSKDVSETSKLYLPNPFALAGGSGGTIPESEITDYPLDPLTYSEIRLAVFVVKTMKSGTKWVYKSITLKEPSKDQLYNSFVTDDDISVSAAGQVERRAWALVLDPKTYESFEAVINLNKITLDSWKPAPKSVKPPMVTFEDITTAEEVALENPDVIQRIEALNYNVSQVVCDVWEKGYINDNPDYTTSKRLLQIYMYGVEFTGENYYAHPFDFVVFVDTFAKVVRGIENLPIQTDSSRTNRTGDSVPAKQANYFAKFLPPGAPKDKLNPIQISQPGGPSFQIQGHKVAWQNFSLRIGNNGREGVVLYHVKYNDGGKFRPILYRVSLSEIFVSYGDPRPPYHRKKSFDMGEFSLGFSTSELTDKFCPGEAHYLDMVFQHETGEPYTLKKAICIMEEDAGVLWAHYDWTQQKTAMSRSQRLSISFLATVCHSDYWISWRLHTDATIELSVKLTGLKNTNLMAVDIKAPSYGNLMSPQVYSPITQYFFAARIDADVDDIKNSAATEDISMPKGDSGSSSNPYGNAITTKEKVFSTVAQSKTNLAQGSGRTWKVLNPQSIHPLTKSPRSWKLIPQGNYVPLLLKKNSPLRKNTAWTDYNMWVTQYNDEQIFASGLWMNSDGLADWVNANSTMSIVNKDIVLWHIFGITNVPSVENWPVNSDLQSTTGFILKPNGFFDKNPCL